MSENLRRILIATLVAAVIVRGLAALLLGDQVTHLPGTADQLSYHNLAIRVLEGHGFTFDKLWWPVTKANEPTAHWSFLYTGYQILVYALFGPHPLVARLIQAIVVGLLHPYLAYLIGRRLFGTIAGLAAAMLTAVYTYFIYYSATLMTESFYITAILAGLYLAIKISESGDSDRIPIKAAILLGLTLGLAVLFRQLFLLFIPFLFLWLWWAGGKQKLAVIFIASLVIAGLILPFTVYNFTRFNRFVLLNTNAGYAFFWGNHPIYGTHFEPILPPEMGSYQELIPEELRQLDEASLDQALLKRSIQFIKDDPVRYLFLSISRIPAYFMFWPSNDSSLISNFSRMSSFALTLPFMLVGLWLSFKRRGPAILQPPAQSLLLLLLFIFIYTLIHLLSWALIRYRLPVDAVLLIFAGLGITEIAARIPFLRKLLDYILGPDSIPSKFPSRGIMNQIMPGNDPPNGI